MAAVASHILHFLRLPVILCSLGWILHDGAPSQPRPPPLSPPASQPASAAVLTRCSSFEANAANCAKVPILNSDIPPLLFSPQDYYDKCVTALESGSVFGSAAATSHTAVFISSAPRQPDGPIVFLVEALARLAFPLSDLTRQDERSLSDIDGWRQGFEGREVAPATRSSG